jgi:hypothetical protein
MTIGTAPVYRWSRIVRVTPPPLIRASLFHSNLDALEALGPIAASKVRDALPPGFLEEIEATSRLAWVPLEHDIVLTETVGRVLGRDKMRAWSRDGIVRAIEGPLLAPLVRSVLFLFGATPHSVLRRLPQAWSMCNRNCGDAAYTQVAERRGLVRLSDLPAVYLEHALYREGLAGAIEGGIIVGGESGEVLPELDPATNDLLLRCSW